MDGMGRERPSTEGGDQVRSLERRTTCGILNEGIIWSRWNVTCRVGSSKKKLESL